MFDVLIIGAGIIGSLCGFELAKKNLSVALLEKDVIGHGASGNSAAMLELQLDAHRGEPFYSLAWASHKRFPSLIHELQRDSGIDIQYETKGILQLAFSDEDKARLQQETARQQSLGLKTRWLTSSELAQQMPTLSPSPWGAIFFEEDGQVNGEKFLAASLLAARRKGAQLFEKTGETSLLIEKGRVVGVQSAKQEWRGKKILIAAGAWTDHVLAPLSIKTGIEPIRGQLIVYDTASPVVERPVYTQRNGYLTPKNKEGFTLAGTTVEKAGFDTTTTEAGRKSIAENAEKLCPALARCPIRGVIAGLRPKSPDELPIIRAVASHPNVIVAAGHYRNGILLAPVTADRVAALIG